MSDSLARLKEILGTIHDLERLGSLAAWDQETMMPPQGAEGRADQRATLVRLSHELLVSHELGRLLEEVRPYEETLPHDSDDASVIRVTRRDHEKARRVPPELRAELSRSGSLGLGAWLEARARRDFDVLLPYLERQLELRRRYIECFEPREDDYDVLLDDYEAGLTTAEAESVLEQVRDELVPLVAAMPELDPAEDVVRAGPFEIAAQRRFSVVLLRRLGFEPDAWRLDRAEHPFATAASVGDIRITTHFHESHLGGVFACIHEFGHGLYERQVSPSLARTRLGTGASAALHESQSRMWENLVGRSRSFWVHAYPRLQAELPERLGGADLDTFYRSVNRVQPSLVRVDADEITYNLHIIIRFELEREVLAGRLELRDLPEAFDARMLDYLGLEVPDVRSGVLQDMHWADLTFGYFPTYSLGNVISIQLWDRARGDLPELDQALERGEYGDLREWLRENLHRHGRKFTPQETLARAVGGPIDPAPYIRYLKSKLETIFGVAAA
ncbi:MAG TPA: carboxypeptidase M32 [Gaiellaceae bacterium]